MNNRLFVLIASICLLVSGFSIYYIFVNTALAEKYYPVARIQGVDFKIQDSKMLDEKLQKLLLAKLPRNLIINYEGQSFSIATEELNIKPDSEILLNYGKGQDPQKIISEGISILLSQGAEIDYEIDLEKIFEILPFKISSNSTDYANRVGDLIYGCSSKTINYNLDKVAFMTKVKASLENDSVLEIKLTDIITDPQTIDLIKYCDIFTKLSEDLTKETGFNTSWEDILETKILNESLTFSIKEPEILQELFIKKFSETYSEKDDGEYFDKNGKRYYYRMPKNGKELSINDSMQNLRLKLASPGSNFQILAFNDIVPEYILLGKEFVDISAKLGEGISRLDIYRDGIINYRIFNSQEPLKALNNFVLEPGQVFSFHKDSGVAFGQVRSGIGVCNSTTTLFRAAIHSGLEIVDRSPHTSYIQSYEYGADYPLNIVEATYFGGPLVDFKFKNDTAYPIALKVTLYRKNDGYQYHTVEVYGSPKEPKREVELTDWKKWGARDSTHFSGSFTRVIKVDGDIIKTDTYKSYYFD